VKRPRGILILGAKKSEEPYTPEERKLFAAVAAQMSVAHETHWLANERVAAVIAERNRMARELHDSLAQGFAGISLHLQSAARNIGRSPDAALGNVEQARKIARESLAEARRSVHDLRAGHDAPNLAAMLQELTEQLSSTSVQVELDAPPLPELSADLTRNLFRIAQESVTNALKHAAATRISISLSVVDNQVLLKVRDNGRGFACDEARSGGYGLVGMRERAGQIRGQLEITSEAGHGTEVVVQAICS